MFLKLGTVDTACAIDAIDPAEAPANTTGNVTLLN